MSLQALISPRLLRRGPLDFSQGDKNHKTVDVKSGDINIINNVGTKKTTQTTHLEVVKDDLHLLANFYVDSEKQFRYGVLCMDKCKTSLSSSDLTTIEVTKQTKEEDTFAPGLLLKAKSHEEALEWVEAMSPKSKKTFECGHRDE